MQQLFANTFKSKSAPIHHVLQLPQNMKWADHRTNFYAFSAYTVLNWHKLRLPDKQALRCTARTDLAQLNATRIFNPRLEEGSVAPML